MIVMKFGGTSVGDAAAINQAAEIVRGRAAQAPVVVVSAMARVTDTLLRLAHTAKERRFDEADAIINELRERHLTIARELLSSDHYLIDAVGRGIEAHFTELESLAHSVATLGELTARSQDAIVSFGERLSSLLMAATLSARGTRAELVDSRRFIITDDNFTMAAPNTNETEMRARASLLPLLEQSIVPVAQGFIGSTMEGVTTTIGRGGSDYSAGRRRPYDCGPARRLGGETHSRNLFCRGGGAFILRRKSAAPKHSAARCRARNIGPYLQHAQPLLRGDVDRPRAAPFKQPDKIDCLQARRDDSQRHFDPNAAGVWILTQDI
jgi:hypothetical protein